MKTADTLAIQKAVQEKFCQPAYATFFEVSSATGLDRKRYADALVFSLYPSRGLERIGFEFKVSRADWLSELRSPEKAENISQYCDRWYVVSVEGVIEPGELPPTWGHMIFKSGRLKTVVAAPEKGCIEPSREFMAAIMRRNAQAIEEEIKSKVEPALAKEKELQVKRIEAEVAANSREFLALQEKLKTVKEQTGIDLLGWQPTARTIQTMRLALLLEKENMAHTIRMLKSDIDSLSSALEEFEKEHPEVSTPKASIERKPR